MRDGEEDGEAVKTEGLCSLMQRVLADVLDLGNQGQVLPFIPSWNLQHVCMQLLSEMSRSYS